MKSKFLIATGVLVLAGAIAIPLAGRLGSAEGEVTAARLNLLWPDLRALPLPDHQLLALLSMQCQLYREPIDVNAVIACLRRAAREPDFKLPQGIRNAEHELERLLREVPSDRGRTSPDPEPPEHNSPAAPGELLGQALPRREAFA